MSSELFPAVVPRAAISPDCYLPESLQLYGQTLVNGNMVGHPWKLRMLHCERFCSEMLCAMLPIGGLVGSIAFFARVSVAPLISMPFCVIAVSCVVVVIASEILLYAFTPNRGKCLEDKADFLLNANELDKALHVINALAKLSPRGGFVGAFLADPADKWFKTVDELYLRLAMKYAERNDYQMALDCMPRDCYCERSRMEAFLVRVKRIREVPPIIQRLEVDKLEAIWEVRTSQKPPFPSWRGEYQEVYKHVLNWSNTVRSWNPPSTPLGLDEERMNECIEVIFTRNTQEPSSVVKALRLVEWTTLLRESFNSGSSPTREAVEALG